MDDIVVTPHLNKNTQIRLLQRRVKIWTKQKQQNLQPINELNSDSAEEEVAENALNENFNKVLNRLGYEDLTELYRHSKPTQIFGECINDDLHRKHSEKAISNKVEQQLYEWEKQKRQTEMMRIQQLKQEKKENENKPNKNNAKKVMALMGVAPNENVDDIQAICSNFSKLQSMI